MKQQKQSNLERSEARKQQVLDAAEDCFQKFGFHGASMADISKAASMSAGHIYNYFENKEAIINAIVERNIAEFLDFMTEIENESDITRAMVGHIGEGVDEKLDTKYAGLMLEIVAEAARNPKMAHVLRERDRIVRERLRALILRSRAQSNAAVGADVEGQVEVLIALFEGLATRGIVNPDLDKGGVVEIMERMVRNIFAGCPPQSCGG